MAEQGTITLSGLPVDGDTIDASDGQATAINQIANEFNKQVPITKISAEQAWTVYTPTWGGVSSNPTQNVRYLKEGRLIAYMADVPSVVAGSSGTTFTISLPFASVLNTRIPILTIDNGTTTVGRIELQASSTTALLHTSITGAGWTSGGSGKGVAFSITYESTT